MNKLFFTLGFFAIVGLLGIVSLLPVAETGGLLGGGNVPDRCVWYDQSASRSIKDTIKVGGGSVFGFRVTNLGAGERFFSLYDLDRRASNSSNPIYAAPIGGTTASRSVAALVETFPAPLTTTTGITWAVSTQFGNFASSGIDRNNLTVSICYY